MAERPHSRIFKPDLLEGQVCVVSGAGSGLGRETALELARLGAVVVGCGRRQEPLAETAELAAGWRDPSSTRRSTSATRGRSIGFFDGLLERHGRLDVLVNNAGGQFLAPAEAITPKGFRTVIELNVEGTWLMTHAAATKAFIPQGGGKVLSVTLSPHNGMPGMVHSGAARAAVENMMRTLAVEWARFGIKTCALAAGQFATETLLTKYPQVVVDNLERSIPVGRAGRAEEMAWLVAYLASPAGDFFSGTTITIDGARDNWFGPWPPEAIASESRRARCRGAAGGSSGCAPALPSAWLEDDQRDFAALAAGCVVFVAAVCLDRQLPEALALLRLGDAGVDLQVVAADLHGRVWIGLEVVEPGRVLGVAALGGDDDEVVAVPYVEQRRGALGAALGSDMVEQQHLAWTAGNLVARACRRSLCRELCADP